MKRNWINFILGSSFLAIVFIQTDLVMAGEPNSKLTVVKEAPNGLLAKMDGVRNVLFLEGTPEEMGEVHGQLMSKEIGKMRQRVLLVGMGYSYSKSRSFFETIAEAEHRAEPFMPKRFLQELDALARASGQQTTAVRQINFFSEMFHCSGIAACGKATPDGRIRHVRVLDYMRDIGLQEYAVLFVFMPKGYNAWLSVAYPGFIGTVTCMNDKGLAMGEIGGAGEGKWDGLPMTFLMRRIMEECSTVDEAIQLMKSQPLTCDYYYVLSDRYRHMAGIAAIAGAKEPVRVFRPGVDYKDLPEIGKFPGVLEDVVYITAPDRINALFQRLKDNYGKLDAEKLKEVIKRPVCMKSNLHNAIFEPETLDFEFAEAGKDSIAADNRYFKANLTDLIKFYQKAKKEQDHFFD